jgi:hypothetical protein
MSNPSERTAESLRDYWLSLWEECRGGEFRALEKKSGKWQLLTGRGLWNHCVWYVRDRRA